MGLLQGALPRAPREIQGRPIVQSDYGSYRGYWVGMTPTVAEKSEWNDQCRVCKGAGTGRNGEGQCTFCGGDGIRVDTFVMLKYALENGITEVEKVAFKVSPPGQMRDGTVQSPSTLFKRLRTFSGLRDADAAQLDQWVTSVLGDDLNHPKPVKIPITVNIGDNQKATALKITDVMLRQNARDVLRQAVRAATDIDEAPQAKRESAPITDRSAYAGAPTGSFAGDSFDDDVPF